MPDDSDPTLPKTPPNLRPTPKNVTLRPKVDGPIDAGTKKPVSSSAGSHDAPPPGLNAPFIDAGVPDIRFFGEGTITLDNDEDILGDVEVGLGSGDAPKDADEVEISELIDRLSGLVGEDGEEKLNLFKLLTRVEEVFAALNKLVSDAKDKNPAGGTTEPVVEPAGAPVTEETAEPVVEPVVEPVEAAEETPQEEEPEPARKVRDYERILKALGDLPSEERGIFTSRYGDEGETLSVVNVERIKKLYGIFENLTEEEVELHFKGFKNREILEAWDEVFGSLPSGLGVPLKFSMGPPGVEVSRKLHYTRISSEAFEPFKEDGEKISTGRFSSCVKPITYMDVLDGDASRRIAIARVGHATSKTNPQTTDRVVPPVMGPYQTYIMLRTVRGVASYPNSGMSVHLKLNAGERVSFDGVHIKIHSIEEAGAVPQFFTFPGFSGAIREGWARLEDEAAAGSPVEASVPDIKPPAAQELPAESSTGHTGSTGYVRTRLALPVDPMERRALVKFLASHDADLLTLDKSSVEVSIPR